MIECVLFFDVVGIEVEMMSLWFVVYVVLSEWFVV